MQKNLEDEAAPLDFSKDYLNSGFFSKIIHGWANRFIVYAKKNKKVPDDTIMIAMPAEYETNKLTESIEDTFNELKKENPDIKFKDKIRNILIRVYKKDLFWS